MLMPSGFLDSGRTFLLIDGAKVEYLPEIIYTESPDASCDALYRGTELAERSEISPWLVEVHAQSPLGSKCFEHWMYLGVGIAIQANDGVDYLVARCSEL